MIAFYWYVLCIGILLSWHANDVMFLGCQANFGTQKNYPTGTLGQKFWYPWKGLVTRNVHIKYESPTSSGKEAMAKVKVFEK